MAHANFIESGETVTVQSSIPITGKEVIPEEIDLHSTLPTQTAKISISKCAKCY